MFQNQLFFVINRKALKKFKPLQIDATESVELKTILNEIDVLKKLCSKSQYVINYLDTFATFMGEDDEYKVYHIVTDIYEVEFFSNFIS